MIFIILFLIIFINFNLAVQLLNTERTSSENQLEAQIYTLQVPVKFSDGGDIWIIKDFEGPNGFKVIKNQTVNIEEVLKAVNGIDVEYIEPNKEDNKFIPNVEKSGQIRFKQNIDIRGGGKRIKKLKGEKMYIWDFAHKMRRIDNRWMITGEKPKSEHIFRFLFDGHAMLTLLNNEEKEIARFHFNRQGLNLFRKEKGNFIVNQQDLSEKIDKTSLKRFRGQYIKNGFNPPLYTRKITIEEVKRIAHNVINGRIWGGKEGFKCHHFVYSLAQALIEEENKNKLINYWSWPESLRLLDERINRLDGTFAFSTSVPLITNNEQINNDEILKICLSQNEKNIKFPLSIQCSKINKKFKEIDINKNLGKIQLPSNYLKIKKPSNLSLTIKKPISFKPFLSYSNTSQFLKL